MAAYLLWEPTKDLDGAPEKRARYLREFHLLLAKYGGKVVAAGGAIEVLEGPWRPMRLVIMEFENMSRLKAFYDSPEYAPLKDLRHQTSEGNVTAVEGV